MMLFLNCENVVKVLCDKGLRGLGYLYIKWDYIWFW